MVDRAGTTAPDDPIEMLRGNAQRALQQGDLGTAQRGLTALLARNARDHAALLQPGGVLILPELCVVVFRDVAPDETAAVA